MFASSEDGLEDVDPDWGWMFDRRARQAPTNQSGRLSALRRAIYEEATTGKDPATVTVVLYALTTVGKNPDEALKRAKAYADDAGWRVTKVLFDDSGMTDPETRRGWRGALNLVATGYAHGVLTVDRSAVSTSDYEYEHALKWLRMRAAFLAHVPPHWQLPSSNSVPGCG